MRKKLLKAMEDYFGADQKRISHARKVLAHAEEMLDAGGKGDREVVEAAAILHDIGIHEAERKYGSNSGHYQEIEGPHIAAEILAKIGFPEEKMGKVLEIIAHHHTPGKIKTTDFKILYEADRLVNVEEAKEG